MRITTRTPPVRIPAADMVAMAALPAEHAGLLLRWGMRLYGEGQRTSLADARADARLDERAMGVLVDGVRRMLDQEALRDGWIVVRCFAEAAEARDKVAVARIRTGAVSVRAARTATASGRGAAEASKEVSAPAKVQPARRKAPSVKRGPDHDEAGMPDVTEAEGGHDGGQRDLLGRDQRTEIVDDLVARGVQPDEARVAAGRWIAHHGIRETYDAVAGLAGRRVTRVIAYVDRMLENARSQKRTDMPSAIRMANNGRALPRMVKRRIRVGPQASWEFLGWTARGHGRDGGVREMRKEVWRTNTGVLAFQEPPEGREIPDYSQDPGVYDVE